MSRHSDPRKTRTRRRPGTALPPLAVAVLLAGCGGSGGPHMARADVAPLIRLADQISTEGACAQAHDIRKLSAVRVALVNAHRVPRALAESLSSGVNALVDETPPCFPAVPPTSEQQTPTITVIPEHGRGHGHKHKKHKQHGDEGGD
jgi:hypothetical protein